MIQPTSLMANLYNDRVAELSVIVRFRGENLLLEVVVQGELGGKASRGGWSSACGCCRTCITNMDPVCPICRSQPMCVLVPGHGCLCCWWLSSQKT